MRVADFPDAPDRLLGLEPVDHRLDGRVGRAVFLGKASWISRTEEAPCVQSASMICSSSLVSFGNPTGVLLTTWVYLLHLYVLMQARFFNSCGSAALEINPANRLVSETASTAPCAARPRGDENESPAATGARALRIAPGVPRERFDRNREIVGRRQVLDLKPAVLAGPGRSNEPGRGFPAVRILRKDDDGVVQDDAIVPVGNTPDDTADPIGQDNLYLPKRAIAKVGRLIGDVGALEADGFDCPVRREL